MRHTAQITSKSSDASSISTAIKTLSRAERELEDYMDGRNKSTQHIGRVESVLNVLIDCVNSSYYSNHFYELIKQQKNN